MLNHGNGSSLTFQAAEKIERLLRPAETRPLALLGIIQFRRRLVVMVGHPSGTQDDNLGSGSIVGDGRPLRAAREKIRLREGLRRLTA